MHPGQPVRQEILPARDRPKTEIAKLLGVSRQTLYDILEEKQPVTPMMALRVGKLCGNGPDLWLNLQMRYDLQRAEQELGEKLNAIHCSCCTSSKDMCVGAGGDMRLRCIAIIGVALAVPAMLCSGPADAQATAEVSVGTAVPTLERYKAPASNAAKNRVGSAAWRVFPQSLLRTKAA